MKVTTSCWFARGEPLDFPAAMLAVNRLEVVFIVTDVDVVAAATSALACSINL